jgi:hypothetical protein
MVSRVTKEKYEAFLGFLLEVSGASQKVKTIEASPGFKNLID